MNEISRYLPYGKQTISDKDISAVVDVLKSDFLTQGPVVPQFEHAIAHKVNAKHAIAVVAQQVRYIACMALNLKRMIGFGRHQRLLLHRRIVRDIVVQK